MNYLFITIGSLCVALGAIGIFVPLFPTTPFLLLAALLFARSSTRLYQKLIRHRYLGPYIRDYLENRTIPHRVKATSISMMWASILLSLAFTQPAAHVIILMMAIGTGVSVSIVSFKSSPRKKR